MRFLLPAALAALSLSACAHMPTPVAETAVSPARDAAYTWAYEASDLEPESGYIFGRLDNGMRYVVRANGTPDGTALVRMEIEAGRLDENGSERGLAHYVEHMAFNGSTNVPEGEMVKLLERLGLAFGADTNAATGFDFTQYRLDLPRASDELLDTALFLMRETASELNFAPEAVERERGVLTAERRDRTNYAQIAAADQIDFFMPSSLLSERFPLIDREDVDTATAADLRAFWERTYVPAATTLVVVGDFDAASVEAKIRERFGDWTGATDTPQPSAGPVDFSRSGLTDIYTDPALDAQVIVGRLAPYIDKPDTSEKRRADIVRALGYAIVNRRLQRLALSAEPPFRQASFGTGDIFEAARQTAITVAALEGDWAGGVEAAAREYARIARYGVTEAELAEQVARRRTALQNAVAGAATRDHSRFANEAIALARNEVVPTAPQRELALFEDAVTDLTPDAVVAALRADMVPLDDPLIRFQGRSAPEGGEASLRETWARGVTGPVAAPEENGASDFPYTEFGEPGTVVSDDRESALGIRRIVFDNGVRLNLKQTALEDDRVRVSYVLDGGNFLDTRDDPNATSLAALLPSAGLGQLSIDELQSVLAGRNARFDFDIGTDSFSDSTVTTPRDLELQLQLIAAYLTDPGYRPEALVRYRNSLDDYFARLRATPSGALQAEEARILSDDDPRFTLKDEATYRALDFEGLRAAIGDRLARGALEVALVGDIEDDEAIALVAKTLGALPKRENAFSVPPGADLRSFTEKRGRRTLYHTGEADQALLRFVWPTGDATDADRTVSLALLRAVVDLEITDELRERLGQAYSPGVASDPSLYYSDYGTFAITASVDVAQLDAARTAIVSTLERLRREPVKQDVLQRARQPILERFENTLKDNSGWLAYARRAQSEPERITRFVEAPERYNSFDAQALQALAQRYLDPQEAVEIVVLPENAADNR